MKNSPFQNLPSLRMYEFLMQKMESKELTRQQIADALEVYQGNPSTYFHGLKTGTLSVKVEHILKAQEAFGLDPCTLFHEVGEMVTTPTVSMQINELLDVIKSQQQTINNLVGGNSANDRRKNA